MKKVYIIPDVCFEELETADLIMDSDKNVKVDGAAVDGGTSNMGSSNTEEDGEWGGAKRHDTFIWDFDEF